MRIENINIGAVALWRIHTVDSIMFILRLIEKYFNDKHEAFLICI